MVWGASKRPLLSRAVGEPNPSRSNRIESSTTGARSTARRARDDDEPTNENARAHSVASPTPRARVSTPRAREFHRSATRVAIRRIRACAFDRPVARGVVDAIGCDENGRARSSTRCVASARARACADDRRNGDDFVRSIVVPRRGRTHADESGPTLVWGGDSSVGRDSSKSNLRAADDPASLATCGMNESSTARASHRARRRRALDRSTWRTRTSRTVRPTARASSCRRWE